MSFSFEGYQLTPGMHDERYTDETNIFWGRWDQREYVQAIVDSASTDAGNSDTTQLRTGLAMGVVASTGKFKPWNPYATDGTNYVVGFLLDEIDLTYMGSVKARLNGIVVKGQIKADFVVIPGEAARGIVGTTYEFLLREQCAGRFLFDDDLGATQVTREYTIGAAVTALTVTEAMNKTLFVTDTALGADCTLTLPVPRPGLEYRFVHPSTTAGTELILDGPGTGEFWAAGAAANTLTIVGDNTTGIRTLRCVRVTDTTTDVFAYVLSGGVT
jgi:hypothetical protein